ncbi:MAG TPA: efflux RND transporter periplasmic adaptor subunit [Candidatus Saccharimonadales bacterium]|nr:efflux RND transporter periplasmic adaptor subunit [Candidatus Saccharimonadales bacterium]
MRTSCVRPILALALPAALALAGCARGGSEPAPDAAPAVVATFRAGGGAAAGELVLPGRVKAAQEVTVSASLAARLTELPLREGQSFRQGEVLARFGAEETRRALEAARSGLAAAALRRDQARLQEARLDSLYGARVAALRELEGAQLERRAAEAAYSQARAAAEELGAGAAVVAPFDGVVVRRRVDPGANLGPGQPLLDIRSAAPGDIEVAIPEAQVAEAQAGAAAFQVGDGRWRPARLARLEGMIDFASRTRTAHLVPARGAALPEPGAYVRVRFEPPAAARAAAGAPPASAAGAPGPLTVPTASLVRRGELAGVYVVRDGRAELRWLRLGRQEGAEVEVLAGLWPGEAVVADPQGLSDGRAVKVSR